MSRSAAAVIGGAPPGSAGPVIRTYAPPPERPHRGRRGAWPVVAGVVTFVCMFEPAKILEGLNDSQRQAATHGPGPLLVLAGAGTGKTRTLVARAAWLKAQG